MKHQVRPEVALFGEAMESKLAEHDDDRGERGWEEDSIRSLLARLREEADELEVALDYCDPSRVAHEAADVGNFAMMIHDIVTTRTK
jgi:NTP pyrophosphatase (non-canonical NTP hydrolase)